MFYSCCLAMLSVSCTKVHTVPWSPLHYVLVISHSVKHRFISIQKSPIEHIKHCATALLLHSTVVGNHGIALPSPFEQACDVKRQASVNKSANSSRFPHSTQIYMMCSLHMCWFCHLAMLHALLLHEPGSVLRNIASPALVQILRFAI